MLERAVMGYSSRLENHKTGLTHRIDAFVEIVDEAVDGRGREHRDGAKQEQDVENGQSDEERGDLRLHGPLAQDRDGQHVGEDADDGDGEQPDTFCGEAVLAQRVVPPRAAGQERLLGGHLDRWFHCNGGLRGAEHLKALASLHFTLVGLFQVFFPSFVQLAFFHISAKRDDHLVNASK